MIDLYDFARSFLGTEEIEGEVHNDTIVNFARECGINWIKTDEVPWCSTFVNFCAMKTGYKRSGSAAARSWLKVGKKTGSPEPGTIAIFKRGKNPKSGHVGFYAGEFGDSYIILGGNQSNKVKYSNFKMKDLIEFRVLEKV